MYRTVFFLTFLTLLLGLSPFHTKAYEKNALHTTNGNAQHILLASTQDFSRVSDPNQTDKRGRPIVFDAIYKGGKLLPVEGLHILLKAGADPNKPDTKGQTPLHFAAEHKAADAIKALLAAGAKVNAQNKEGETPLFCAVEEGAGLDIVKILLAAGADPNIAAAKRNNSTPLIEAVRENQPEVLDALLSAGAKVDMAVANGRTALIFAIRDEALPLIRKLLAAGANPNLTDKSGSTPIMYAASEGMEMLTSLVEAKADALTVDQNGTNLFMVCCSRASYTPEQLKTVLGWGFNINATDKKGRTALMYAAKAKNSAALTFLLASGAKVNAKDEEGNTALLLCDMKKETVKLLLDAGADVKAVNMDGVSVIYNAASDTDLAVIRALIAKGAPMNIAKAKDGYTPLMFAVRMRGKLELIRLLVDSGADVHATGKDGVTVMSLAEKWGEADVRAYLKGKSGS